MRHKFLLLLLVGTLSAPALGGPAPWYWWFSRNSDTRLCLQTSPGEGWVREPQPFRDAHCRSRM